MCQYRITLDTQIANERFKRTTSHIEIGSPQPLLIPFVENETTLELLCEDLKPVEIITSMGIRVKVQRCAIAPQKTEAQLLKEENAQLKAECEQYKQALKTCEEHALQFASNVIKETTPTISFHEALLNANRWTRTKRITPHPFTQTPDTL